VSFFSKLTLKKCHVYFTPENIRKLRSPEIFCVEEYSKDEIDMNELPTSSFATRRSRRNSKRQKSTAANISVENKNFPTSSSFDLNKEWDGED